MLFLQLNCSAFNMSYATAVDHGLFDIKGLKILHSSVTFISEWQSQRQYCVSSKGIHLQERKHKHRLLTKL